MAGLSVEIAEIDDGWMALVEVVDANGRTQHNVTIRDETYDELTGGVFTPEDLVRASFDFLLEREPKEAILRHFDLEVIGRYFPEYKDEIRRLMATD